MESLLTIQNYVVTGQIISILFSLVVIAIITSLVFRTIKIGLLSIIPLGIAVIVNFGVMGIFGIKLDIATALIASFAIGIGIDDTIHFLLNFKKEMDKPENRDRNKEEIRKRIVYNALQYTSKAIIFTSLALICAFILVGFSSFLPIKYFSILITLTMFNATIATLMFIPSVILLFPGLLKSRSRIPAAANSTASTTITSFISRSRDNLGPEL
ncbi:MAG: MMPL family transporter [Planctomycetes bacterium]|nr:MMPL family transporter [Planctomycetota bacterium]